MIYIYICFSFSLSLSYSYLHRFQNEIRQEYVNLKNPNHKPESSFTEEPSITTTTTTAATATSNETSTTKEEEEENKDNISTTTTDNNNDSNVEETMKGKFSTLEKIMTNPNYQSSLQSNMGNADDVKFLTEPYPWRGQAVVDPNSVAGCLSRMTTEDYLDDFVMSTKLGLVVAKQHSIYEEGSANVNQVAILSARAMELPLPGQSSGREDDDHRYEEFRASEEAHFKYGVAAQIDVLYEVTNRFHEQVYTGSITDDGTQETQTEYVEYTSLGVAVFEGWLDKGAESVNEEGLQWRVPLMREPYEFPMIASASRTVLSTEDANKIEEQGNEEKKEEEAATTTEADQEESSSSSTNSAGEDDNVNDKADNANVDSSSDSSSSKDTSK
jgi:hypothetical protein